MCWASNTEPQVRETPSAKMRKLKDRGKKRTQKAGGGGEQSRARGENIVF